MKTVLKKLKKSISEFFTNNKEFLIYIFFAITITILLRILTTTFISIKAFITDLGMILIFASFAFLKKKQKGKKRYLTGWLIFLAVLCCANDVYYAHFSSFASLTEFNSLFQARTVTGSLVERLDFTQFIYFVFPIIIIILNKKNQKKANDIVDGKNKDKFKKILISGLMLIVLSGILSSKQDLSRLYKQWNRSYIVNRYGIITYQLADGIGTITSKINSSFGFDNALVEVDDYIKNKEHKETNEYTDIFKDYNIVFVHMESIQSFLIDQKYNNEYVLPTVQKLINEGMYFSNFYPEISAGTSSDTEFSLLTSCLPTRIGIVFTKYYNHDYITIPNSLYNKGYYTFSMHGNDFTMWNRNNAHPYLGYNNFYFKDKYDVNETNSFNLGITDSSFFEQSKQFLEEIENNNEHYMGTIITLSNHSPYIYLENYKKLDLTVKYTGYNKSTEKDETVYTDYLTGTTIGNYIISSHSADVDLGEFVKYVEDSNNYDKTIFVFYGDHDPRLSSSEYNYFYNYDPINQELLNKNDENYYDYNSYIHFLNKKTPLIIWSKDSKVRELIKGEYDYPMGMIDIMPTIGNMMGFYNEYAIGKDIFDTRENNIVPFPTGDFITNNYYYSSSTNSTYILKPNVIIDDISLNKNIDHVNDIIEVSNDIVIYNMIKYHKDYRKNNFKIK